MTLPANRTFDEESKQYLRKSIFWSTVTSIAVFVISLIILIVILNKDSGSNVQDAQSLREIRKLNDTFIAIKTQQDQDLQKRADSNKMETAKTRSDLNLLRTDLKKIKLQRDENISAIRAYQSPDIISAFSNIERQYNASK